MLIILTGRQQYVHEHKISFSTDPESKKRKTKEIIFSKKSLTYDRAQLSLNWDKLPWITRAMHIGNTIINNMDRLTKDCMENRARYIERNCELNQEFNYAHPEVNCQINRIYNSSFPGSVLWDITHKNFNQFVNSWATTSVCYMWDIPYSTHRHLVKPLGVEHALSMIITRYFKFIKSIKKSSKIPVQYMVLDKLPGVQ